VAFLLDGTPAAEGPEASWALYERHHDDARARREERRDLETDAIGEVNRRIEESRLSVREVELSAGKGPQAWEAAVREDEKAAIREEADPAAEAPVRKRTRRVLEEAEKSGRRGPLVLERAIRDDERAKASAEIETAAIRTKIATLDAENARFGLLLETATGERQALPLGEIVRAYAPNRLGFGDKFGIYASRWGEFVSAEPREANSEGGVFAAIFGTVAMTLIMSLLVVPFGVLAALYLREYAKPGMVVSGVRIAINNLAGVPSIVFGVFGLGFFCYLIGSSIDEVFFSAKLPNPTYGKGGLIWASLTLALLTLPVVIVATEEALAAVPRSMREGSLACGASKWQTIRRIVLPRAMPGIMTGMILAIARGAGEVAPLMLVGAVKLAPELPVDGTFPFVHGERSFMHLGFHVYDLGFQSPNSEAAKPMVYTTTMLLIGIVVLLNVLAVWVRSRLRRRFAVGGHM
jgi:phosphate transport system permease protein